MFGLIILLISSGVSVLFNGTYFFLLLPKAGKPPLEEEASVEAEVPLEAFLEAPLEVFLEGPLETFLLDIFFLGALDTLFLVFFDTI